jgi:hypothetical protein
LFASASGSLAFCCALPFASAFTINDNKLILYYITVSDPTTQHNIDILFVDPNRMNTRSTTSASGSSSTPLNLDGEGNRDGDLTDYDSDGEGAASVGRFDSANRNRPLVGNERLCRRVGGRLRLALVAFEAADPQELAFGTGTSDMCLSAERDYLLPFKPLEERLNDENHHLFHREECGAGKELRRIFTPAAEMFTITNITEANLLQFAALFDTIVQQHTFLRMTDCCPQVQFISRSRSALDTMTNTVCRHSDKTRRLVALNMQYANELPGDLRNRLCATRESSADHQPATAASGGATIVTQTNIPSDALDLKPESLMKWIRYCNSCISSGQDLRIGSWPINFKAYVNNRLTYLAVVNGRPKSEGKVWQTLPLP